MGAKIAQHEEAAHQKRNWVRLTYDCNDRCIFCLDSETHDGSVRDRNEVKAQILEGRRAGAERLILSGGEPTIHPDYVDFIRLGRAAGYARVQTVTNGRMFAYREFLTRCVDAGLGEITFSLHGPNAKIHDALVGVQGAFEEEIRGLENALADARPIVNIDVCVNRANVRHLPEMLSKYIAMGVKEFDLLQVIPFGRAFIEARDTLFYDLEKMRPALLEAFAFSKRDDIHLWLNRFPVEHLEGYEHLIQDPYKLNDEVRGRQQEFARLLDHGEQLSCREPQRCRYCYLERLCDHLEDTRAAFESRSLDVVRVDTEWESVQPVAFGGDPASERRATEDTPQGVRRLPVVAGGPPPPAVSVEARAEAARIDVLCVRAPNLVAAADAARRFTSARSVELELDDPTGVGATLDGKPVTRVVARTAAAAEALLAAQADFEVVVELSTKTAAWLRGLDEVPSRLALRQPTHGRLTDSAERDVDLTEFFTAFRHPVPVEGVPACILGRPPRPRRRTLDATMATPQGRLEIFRYTRRFILDHYRVKSLRCKTCRFDDACDGLHVNHVRAHGFAAMRPVA